MVEFKIRFKSGDVGYFKPTCEITLNILVKGLGMREQEY